MDYDGHNSKRSSQFKIRQMFELNHFRFSHGSVESGSTVVEKKTMKEQKKTRHDLERDQFVAEVLDTPPLFVLIIFCRC
jgi:hypothetical protein